MPLFQLLHRQALRIRVQGQEQDQCAQQRREVKDARCVGQSYPHPRQRWLRARQVPSQPEPRGHGLQNPYHAVPIKDLNTFTLFILC